MNFDGDPAYNFDFEKIEKHCDNLPLSKRVKYLSSIKKAMSLAEAIDHKIPEKFNERLIEKIKILLSRLTKTQEIISGVDNALNDFKKVLESKAPQLAQLISDRVAQGGEVEITRQDIWDIFSNPSYEGSEEYLKAFFQLPPFYGFDVEALELGLNNQTTIEEKAAYMLNILAHYPFVAAYKANVPVAYSDKLVETVMSLKEELTLRSRNEQQSILEETTTETSDFDFHKVMSLCNKIQGLTQQIEYLQYILKNHRQWCIDRGIYLGGRVQLYHSNEPSEEDLRRRFIQKVDLEIEYREKLLQRQSESPAIDNQKPTKEIKLINWLGSQPQLNYLFELLFSQNLVDREFFSKKDVFLSNHFLYLGKPLSSKSLNSSRNRPSSDGKPKRKDDAPVIERIVEQIKKNK